jgi:hypothetical protein
VQIATFQHNEEFKMNEVFPEVCCGAEGPIFLYITCPEASVASITIPVLGK